MAYNFFNNLFGIRPVTAQPISTGNRPRGVAQGRADVVRNALGEYGGTANSALNRYFPEGDTLQEDRMADYETIGPFLQRIGIPRNYTPAQQDNTDLLGTITQPTRRTEQAMPWGGGPTQGRPAPAPVSGGGPQPASSPPLAPNQGVTVTPEEGVVFNSGYQDFNLSELAPGGTVMGQSNAPPSYQSPYRLDLGWGGGPLSNVPRLFSVGQNPVGEGTIRSPAGYLPSLMENLTPHQRQAFLQALSRYIGTDRLHEFGWTEPSAAFGGEVPEHLLGY